MAGVLAAPAVLELFDDLLHVLDLVLVCDQYRILGFDDHQVLDPHGRDQAAVCMHEGVVGVMAESIALEHIACGILGADFPER
ncbi:hypothetical protein D3C78_1752610 [compost metagenome]